MAGAGEAGGWAIDPDWVPYQDIAPAGKDEPTFWGAEPSDELEYEACIAYVLHVADGVNGTAEVGSVSSTTELPDSLDVQEMLRRSYEGDTSVQDAKHGHRRFTNGILDWSHETEDAPDLQGKIPGGWIDPDLLHVGSASHTAGLDTVIQEHPYWVQVNRREFSLLTLDVPTWIENRRPEQQGLYDLVIRKLVALSKGPADNIYGWLDVFFAFCAGKPAVYYSRYVPSRRIYSIARRHHVDLVHLPLQVIPGQLLKRHERFRYMSMTVIQWREYRQRLLERGLPDMAAVLGAHDTEPAEPLPHLGNIDELPWNSNWLRLMGLQREYLAGTVSREDFEKRWNGLASDETHQGPRPPTLEELEQRENRQSKDG